MKYLNEHTLDQQIASVVAKFLTGFGTAKKLGFGFSSDKWV